MEAPRNHKEVEFLRYKNEFWGPAQRTAFEKVKHLLTSCLCLALYNLNKLIILSCDSSTQSVHVLLQREGEKNRPVE